MQLEHSGWSQERGWFCDKYSFDETKTDYEIHWKKGTICKQLTPFENVERDWNYDGDVYSEFGAYFEGGWWTPYHLLDLILEGEATVTGIEKL